MAKGSFITADDPSDRRYSYRLKVQLRSGDWLAGGKKYTTVNGRKVHKRLLHTQSILQEHHGGLANLVF